MTTHVRSYIYIYIYIFLYSFDTYYVDNLHDRVGLIYHFPITDAFRRLYIRLLKHMVAKGKIAYNFN